MFPLSVARPGRLLLGATLVALLMSAVVVRFGIQRDRQFDELVASGTRGLRQGDISGALEALSGALTLNPDSVVAHLRRAEAHAARQDFGPALRDLTEAARLDPGATTPRRLLGDVNYALGRHRQAESRYREFLALDERSAEVWHKLGLTQLLSGQSREAWQSLRQALTLEGHRAETSYVLGLVLLDLKRTPEAIEELRRAVALRPSLKEARVELARQFGRAGRAAEEVAQLEALAVLEPQEVAHRVALAQALLRGGLTQAALASLARARQQFPDNGILEWATGEAWLGEYERSRDQAMLTRAEAALERAAEVWSHPDVRVSRARTHLLAGRSQPALRLLVEAAQTYPVSPRTLRLLAEAARRTGQSAVEYDALAKAVILESTPADPRATIQGYLRLAELATDLGRPTAERWLGDAAAAASAIDGALPRVQAVRKRLGR